MFEVQAQKSGERPSHRRTLLNVVWNYSGQIYQQAISLVLTFYIVRRLAVPEYGLMLFVMSISSTLYLLDMGLSSVLVQAYVASGVRNGKESLEELLSTSFVTLSGLGVLGALLLFGFSLYLPGPFNIPHAYLHEASLIFIIAAGVIMAGLPTVALEPLYHSVQRFDRVNQIQLVCSTIHCICTIGVLAAGFGIVALALVQLVVASINLILLCVSLPSVVPDIQLRLNRIRWRVLGPLIGMSKWAFLNNISAYILEMLVWFFLSSLGSMREAAMFGLASKLPKQLWSLVDRGVSVTLPSMAQDFHKRDTLRLRQTYLKSQKLVIGAILPFIALGSIFAGPLIQLWAGTPYAGAALVMQWLLLAAFSHACLYTSDLLLYACGQLKKAAFISFAGGALSIVAAYLLAPRYGASGIAFAIAVTQLIIVCSWFTNEGCRLSGISISTLISTVAGGLFLPVVTMATGVILILSVRRLLSPVLEVIAATFVGCLYLGLWGMRTALPLYRNQTEPVG